MASLLVGHSFKTAQQNSEKLHTTCFQLHCEFSKVIGNKCRDDNCLKTVCPKIRYRGLRLGRIPEYQFFRFDTPLIHTPLGSIRLGFYLRCRFHQLSIHFDKKLARGEKILQLH